MTIRYLVPLSAAEQTGLGLAEPQPFAMADRVRYSELDVLNHVNNKAYVEWFETARTEHFFRLCAPLYGTAPQPRTVLRNAEIHYIREMLAGESYITTMRVTAYRNTSYSIEQQIWSGGVMRTRLTGVMVMLRPDGSGRYPLPEALVAYLAGQEGAQQH